jgi:hypothetical protein
VPQDATAWPDFALPGDCTVATLKRSGWPVGWQRGKADNRVRTLGDGLRATVVIEVGRGEPRVGGVDQDAIRRASSIPGRKSAARLYKEIEQPDN